MRLKTRSEIICYCNDLGLHLESIKLCDAIDRVLPINEMQRLIVEKVFYSLSNIPNFNCDQIEDQFCFTFTAKAE